MGLEKQIRTMKETGRYPYTIHASTKEEYNEPASEGRILERENKDAQHSFQKLFSKNYSGRAISFENDKGKEAELIFQNINYDNNEGNYSLFFEDETNKLRPGPFNILHITSCGCIASKTQAKDITNFLGENWKIKDESASLLAEMLGYQEPGLKRFAGEKTVKEYLEQTLSSDSY